MAHHAAGLRRLLKDDALWEAIRADACAAPLSAPDRALVDYAVALTRAPADGGRERLEALRAAGFDDAAILSATQVVAYFNYVNRIAEGLGVALEPDHAP